MAAKFKPGRTVGIDLGTTRSSVAHVDEFGKAAIIPSAEAELVTPSVVLIEEGDLRIVGSEAKNQSVAAGSRVIRESKRNIGRTDARWEIDGTVYTPEMVGSLILKKLKQDAEVKLGEPVVNAVITVPAYFDDSQRAATEAAGEMAGLNVVAILNEPVAAALAYGLDRDRSDGHVVVYDLGGGTFDVTVMKIEGGQITMLATDGNVELGGKDWDDRLIQHIGDKFRGEYGADPLEDVDAYQQLKNDAESAKESLSSKEKTRVIVQYAGNKMVHELTRDAFEEMTADLLSQTENTLAEVVEDQAGLSWDQVCQILLVGGSSKMPQVARMIQELAGREVKVGDPEPDLCVALGAAAYGAILEAQAVDTDPEMDAAQRSQIKKRIDALPPSRRQKLSETRVTMVTSHAYGVEVIDNSGDSYNDVLIEKNAALPASTTRQYGTYEDNQTSVEVNIWEGEEKNLEFCKKAGTGPITGFPPLPKGSPLEVTMTFTEQGIIEVYAKELTHGRELNMRLERPQGMTEAEKQQASTKLARMQVE